MYRTKVHNANFFISNATKKKLKQKVSCTDIWFGRFIQYLVTRDLPPATRDDFWRFLMSLTEEVYILVSAVYDRNTIVELLLILTIES